MEIGLFEWFDDEKGFGILKTAEGKETFIHVNNWRSKRKISDSLEMPIVFENSFQRNKYSAIKCKIFNSVEYNHWDLIFQLKRSNFYFSLKKSNVNIFQLLFHTADIDYNALKTYIDNINVEGSEDELLHKIFVLNEIRYFVTIAEIKEDIFVKIQSFVSLLDTKTHFNFWKNNTIGNYIPPRAFVIEAFYLFQIEDIKKIIDEEIKSVIILLQIDALSKNFDFDIYASFEKRLLCLEDLGYREVAIMELNNIAENHYVQFVLTEARSLTYKNDLQYHEIKNFILKIPNFVNPELKNKIITIISKEILSNCKFKIIIVAWENSVIKNLPNEITDSIINQNLDDIVYLLRIPKIDSKVAVIILDHLLKIGEYKILLKNSKEKFEHLFSSYDQQVFEYTSDKIYFDLWENKYGEIIPKLSLLKFFDDKLDKYTKAKLWVSTKRISEIHMIEIFYEIINQNININDRLEFYTVSNSVLTILELYSSEIDKLKKLNNAFVNLILWHNKKDNEFDLKVLQKKYIYFTPEDQVYIFKRLFYLKHSKEIDFTIDELDNILRADFDLYLTNEKFGSDFILDISTHIIIEGIKSFNKKRNFLFESTLILEDLKRNSKKRFQVESYFDLCKGRSIPEWNWDTNGKITQIQYPNDPSQYYFAIVIPMGRNVEKSNFYGPYTYFEKNPKFDYLKDEVKKLPERKWHPELNHWGVKSKYENEVHAFAESNRFFVELADKKSYDNNTHLVSYSRNIKVGSITTENIPNGIKYCEGRKANIDHKRFKKEFWWCCNQECFNNSIENHLLADETSTVVDHWEEYTLLDLLHILEINIDEFNGIDYIIDGEYFKFLGHINAFNRLLKNLYCEECENLLYPIKTSHFALYTDVRFHCIDESCSKFHHEIYLNNCLYGECKTIIDSRVSKRCAHGLYICHNCGTCCSNQFFNRRLENLELTGGFIHPELLKNVKEESGHLERKEYYCYNCSNMMNQEDEKVFICKSCNVKYDLGKFKWVERKWTKISERRKDYPR